MTQAAIRTNPVRLMPGEHPIERNNIDSRVLKILRRLTDAGYRAYLVGGCIRDLLLGKQPKDFDIATDARPEEVAELFRNCRLIGRRFRLAHIHFGREIIEVATFRAPPEQQSLTDSYGLVLEDNHYGGIEDDVIRRDFTVNALYYDADRGEILDYIGALNDIDAGILRIIGDPVARYTEDPVRMLRAARFAAKLAMDLATESEAAIETCRDNLRAVPPARLFDEAQKLFLGGYGEAAFIALKRYRLFTMLFPDAGKILVHANKRYAAYADALIRIALHNTDRRIAEDKPVNIAFLLAAFLWPVFQLQYRQLLTERENWHIAMHEAVDIVHLTASERIAIPVRLRSMIREIWLLQARLEQTAFGNLRKVHTLLGHPRFRAGYDFLLIRREAGEDLTELADFWLELQCSAEMPVSPEPVRQTYLPGQAQRRRNRHRRKRR